MTLFLLGLISLLLLYLSYTDITQRTLANRFVFIVAPLAMALSFCAYGQIFYLGAILCLVLGFGLFSLGVIGAGDVKLLTALMFAVPRETEIWFLFFTSCFGLGLILIGWVFFRQNIKQQGLPYGVAISLGFLLHFCLLNYPTIFFS